MPISDKKKKSNIEYNRRQDSITIRPSKEDGAKVRAAAAESGQSIQRYIMQACTERMERDGFQQSAPDKSGNE